MSTTWNVKISELGATTNFSTGDEFVIVQNGETVKIAGNSLASSIATLTNLATRSYVDAIVDLAPETLDTLRELAQAINNDPNFAATITDAINTKITADDWEGLWSTKNTYHLPEGSNLYFTNARAHAAIFDNNNLINFANGGQVGNAQLVHQGQASWYEGMDIYSPAGHEWVQLNYDDRNYVWVTDTFAGIDLTTPEGDWLSWKFGLDATLTLPEGGDIVDSNGVSVLGGVTSYNALTDKPTIPTDINQLTDASGLLGGGSGSYPTAPTFTTVTATQLNVQNVEFTGTGAVTISSGNDLNFEAAGNITFNGQTLDNLGGIALSDLSVAYQPAFANGDLTYNSATGVFTYKPPKLSGFVTTQVLAQEIANLVDSAPGTLDTLNELATALGDDPNFATTVATQIGSKADLTYVDDINNSLNAGLNLKANSSDLATVATSGSYDDLINKPAIPADVSDLIDSNKLLPQKIIVEAVATVTTVNGNRQYTWQFNVLAGQATVEYHSTIITGMPSNFGPSLVFNLNSFAEFPSTIIMQPQLQTIPLTQVLGASLNAFDANAQNAQGNVITNFNPLIHRFYVTSPAQAVDGVQRYYYTFRT